MQVHSCHGPARQVDVLREALLGLLADDPTLEPRDILVMCPDIETYAPLIAADFGLGEVVPDAHPAHQLRVRLADRSLVATARRYRMGWPKAQRLLSDALDLWLSIRDRIAREIDERDLAVAHQRLAG